MATERIQVPGQAPGRWFNGAIGLMALGCIASTAGCADAPAPPVRVEPTTAQWLPTEAPPEDWPEVEEDPADPRLASMFPDGLRGKERLCDLAQVGGLESVRPADRSRYRLELEEETRPLEEVSQRATVRCRTAFGEGWADLTFSKESAPLAEFVDVGQRIRVRIRGHAGHDGNPAMSFVATVGDAPSYPARRWLHANVAAGDNVSITRGDRLCAVQFAGAPMPAVVAADDTPLVEGATHHQLLTCRHALGEHSIEVYYTLAQSLAALRVRRTDVVPLRISEDERGLLYARYLGP